MAEFYTQLQDFLLTVENFKWVTLIVGVVIVKTCITIAFDLLGWLISLSKPKNDIPAYVEENDIVERLLDDNEKLKKVIEGLQKQKG